MDLLSPLLCRQFQVQKKSVVAVCVFEKRDKGRVSVQGAGLKPGRLAISGWPLASKKAGNETMFSLKSKDFQLELQVVPVDTLLQAELEKYMKK